MTFVIESDWLAFRSLRINKKTRQVFVGEKEVKLTKTEFKLLCCLIQHEKRIYTIEEVISCAWGQAVVTNKTINTHLSHIRSKIAGVDFKIKINRNGQICLNDL